MKKKKPKRRRTSIGAQVIKFYNARRGPLEAAYVQLIREIGREVAKAPRGDRVRPSDRCRQLR